MSKLTLKAVKRQNERLQDIRGDKNIPLTVYGPKFESQSAIVDYQEFRKVIRVVQLHQTFTLDLEGEKVEVFVRDFQRNPITDDYRHIDLYAIDPKSAVKVLVPVEFTGDSAALRLGAVFTVARPTIKVKCLPGNIPVSLKGSLNLLKTDGDKIRVSDLEEVNGVEFLAKGNVMIAKTELSRAGKQAAQAAAATAK